MEKQTFDKILDEMLNEAVPKYMETVKYEVNNDIKFSKEHEEKMRKLIGEVRRKETLRTFSAISKRVAIVVIFVTVIMIGLVPNISAWKEKIKEFFTKEESGYSWVLYDDPSIVDELNFISGDSRKNSKITFLDYLPEGYTFDVIFDNFKTKQLILSNGANNINFKISKNANKTLDNDDVELELTKINNLNVYYFKKNEFYSFTWNDKEYMYNLYGNAEKEEFIKIIENINFEEIKNIF